MFQLNFMLHNSQTRIKDLGPSSPKCAIILCN
jgi:hypothetical protein